MNNIIFDMDGVIIDSEPVYMERTRRFLDALGFDVPEEVCNMTCGATLKMSYDIFRQNIDGFDMTYEAYREARRKYVPVDKGDIDMRPYVDKDIYPLLEWLKSHGYHIALASSSPRGNIESFLDQLGILDYFEVIAGGNEFTKNKPDPEIYEYTIGRLGAAPADCLIIEDSTYGIQAGKAAGATVIAKRDDRYGYDQSPADYRVSGLLEIEDIITALQ